jgi:hypothetical protein
MGIPPAEAGGKAEGSRWQSGEAGPGMRILVHSHSEHKRGFESGDYRGFKKFFKISVDVKWLHDMTELDHINRLPRN